MLGLYKTKVVLAIYMAQLKMEKIIKAYHLSDMKMLELLIKVVI